MADSSAVRELRTKPVTMRSVFARETIGLAKEKLIDSGVQERDANNEPLIVAKVFGSVEQIQHPKVTPKDVEDFNPAVNLLCGIVRDNKTYDPIINGTIIGWTERQSETRQPFVVLLDYNPSETNDSSVNTLYTDSIFPVVMGGGFKPFAKLPDGYGYAIYLYLLIQKNIQTVERKVRFVSNNQEVVCQTFGANLFLLSKYSDKIGYKDNCIAIKRILDVNNPTYDVIGLYAPVIARPITGNPIRVGRDITDSSIRYSVQCFADRTTYLVANDGLLCVFEKVDITIKEWMASLLKSDTYCISEGWSATMPYKTLNSLQRYFPRVPYSELIVIVGEGANLLTIERIAEKLVPNYSFVVSTLRLHDLTDNVVCMEARQLSADLQSTTESPIQSSQLSLRPLMKLSDIGDHYVLQYNDKKQFVGNFVFSLNTFYYTDWQYGERWNLFICLNDNTTDPMDRDCQYCSIVSVQYGIHRKGSGGSGQQKQQQYQQLDLPQILTYDQNPYVPIEVLSPDVYHRWTAYGRQTLLPWKVRDKIRHHIYLLERVKIYDFSNIGVNLIRRFQLHQKQRFRFPTKQMNDQFAASNKKLRQ